MTPRSYHPKNSPTIRKPYFRLHLALHSLFYGYRVKGYILGNKMK
jgi:hypothetical protein